MSILANSSDVFTITVIESAQEFKCHTDQHLLAAMQESWGSKTPVRSIPIGCRGGGCGVCRIKITHGDYELRKVSRKYVSEEEQAQGVALACRVYPRSELSVSCFPLITSAHSAGEEKCKKV